MLTFERVLDVFQPFLAEGVYEIILTSHGYTILEWDSRCQEWISLEFRWNSPHKGSRWKNRVNKRNKGNKEGGIRSNLWYT